MGDAAAAFEDSVERSLLRLEQNVNGHFPKVLLTIVTRKHGFLNVLSDMRFRSFVMSDVPAVLWPHALATVSAYASLIFHLLLSTSTGKRHAMD
jgi:hypothetical protein